MEYDNIQRIVLVYGTKDRIDTFLGVEEQAIDEDVEDKIELLEIRTTKHSLFKDLKHFLWKGG